MKPQINEEQECVRDRKPMLTEAQLCHLLNYILGLPIITGKHNILAREIPVMVVSIWPKRTQKQAELWIEQVMRETGMLPHQRKHSGRHSVPPEELRVWMPGYGRKTA